MRASHNPEEEARNFVQLAYRLAFGREADPSGLQTYSQALLEDRESHASILEILRNSNEYKKTIKISSHKSLCEGDISSFFQLAYRLILQREIDREAEQAAIVAIRTGALSHFEALSNLVNSEEHARLHQSAHQDLIKQFCDKECQDRSNQLLKALKQDEANWLSTIDRMSDNTDQYFHFHRFRFTELLHITSYIIRTGHIERVLDCGHKHSGFLLSQCFPGQFKLININIEDASDGITYLDGHIELDLERDDLDTVEINEEFDLIVFTEVIEHLRIHPTKVLRFLANHLSADGKILLTTPNFYNHHNLRSFQRRQSMQPVVPYDLAYENLHFHHVHEYCAQEIFQASKEAGLKAGAFWFSDCWDREKYYDIPREELSNMTFVLYKA